MNQDFDLRQFDTPAYRKILGIAHDTSLTNWYEVIGVPLFESDQAALEGALRSRMEHARRFQIGSYQEQTQLVIEELGKAWIWLLDADRRAQYDLRLRDCRQSSTGPLGNEETVCSSREPENVAAVEDAWGIRDVLSSRWRTFWDHRHTHGYVLSICLGVAVLAFLVLTAGRAAREPSDVPARLPDAERVSAQAHPVVGGAGADAATAKSTLPAPEKPREPRQTGYLVDVMCRQTDVRLLVCLEIVGIDAYLIEAVADDPGFASRISDYRTAREAWGAAAKASEPFDAQDYLHCLEGDRITFTGSKCAASDGWSSVYPCAQALQIADLQRTDDASSLVIARQPRSGHHDPAILAGRDAVTRLLRNPGSQAKTVRLDASGVSNERSPPGYAWICVQHSCYERLLLDIGTVPNARTLAAHLRSDAPASIRVCFRGKFQAAFPILHCLEFSLPKTSARESVAASPPVLKPKTNTGPTLQKNQRRVSSASVPRTQPKPASGVEKRWFKLITGSRSGTVMGGQRFYGTYSKARQEAEKMQRESRMYVRVRPE